MRVVELLRINDEGNVAAGLVGTPMHRHRRGLFAGFDMAPEPARVTPAHVIPEPFERSRRA